MRLGASHGHGEPAGCRWTARRRVRARGGTHKDKARSCRFSVKCSRHRGASLPTDDRRGRLPPRTRPRAPRGPATGGGAFKSVDVMIEGQARLERFRFSLDPICLSTTIIYMADA